MSYKPIYISHDGTSCPFNAGDVVEVVYRNGGVDSGIIGSHMLKCVSFYPSRHANGWFWARSGRPAYASGYDISAYRLIKDAEEITAVLEIISVVPA